jgi:hypothetical protein
MTQRAAEGCEGRWDREREIGQAADRSNEEGLGKYTGNGGKQQTRKNIAKLVKTRQKGNPQIPDSLANEINQKLLKTNQERKHNIQKIGSTKTQRLPIIPILKFLESHKHVQF